MYEVVPFYPKDIFIVYVLIVASCALTYPLIRLLFTALGKGLSKWR